MCVQYRYVWVHVQNTVLLCGLRLFGGYLHVSQRLSPILSIEVRVWVCDEGRGWLFGRQISAVAAT